MSAPPKLNNPGYVPGHCDCCAGRPQVLGEPRGRGNGYGRHQIRRHVRLPAAHEIRTVALLPDVRDQKTRRGSSRREKGNIIRPISPAGNRQPIIRDSLPAVSYTRFPGILTLT